MRKKLHWGGGGRNPHHYRQERICRDEGKLGAIQREQTVE